MHVMSYIFLHSPKRQNLSSAQLYKFVCNDFYLFDINTFFMMECSNLICILNISHLRMQKKMISDVFFMFGMYD